MEWCPLGAWLAFDEDQTNQAPFSSNDECDLWLAVGHPKAEAIRDGIAAALSPAPFGIQVSADPLAPKRKSSASGFDWPRGAFISDHHRSDGGAALFLRLLIFFFTDDMHYSYRQGRTRRNPKKNSIEYRNGSRFKQKKNLEQKTNEPSNECKFIRFFLTPPHFLPRRIVRFYTSSFSTSIESRPKSYRKKNTQKKSLINRITDRSSIESKKRNHWKNGVTEQKKSIGDAIRTTV